MRGSPRLSSHSHDDSDVKSRQSYASSPTPYSGGLDNQAYTDAHTPSNGLARSQSPMRQEVSEISSSVHHENGVRPHSGEYGGTGPRVPPRRRSKERMSALDKVIIPVEDGEDELCQSDIMQETFQRNDSTRLSRAIDVKIYPEQQYSIRNNYTSLEKTQSRGVQVLPTPPYRLRFIPKSCDRRKIGFGVLGRWMFSQLGLGCLLVLWAMAGATAFRNTEGPREEEAAMELGSNQEHLILRLAAELKGVLPDDPVWHPTILKYMIRHEGILASAGVTGRTEHEGDPGHVWTFPGCVLFAISLITTLGFGAPVPKTSAGRAVAVGFSAVGIPLHLILVLNIGMFIAVKLQSWATRKRRRQNKAILEQSTNEESSQNNSSKPEENSCEKTKGIFTSSGHRRTGSEPIIGKQAINNISSRAGLFLVDDPKVSKYLHITESGVNLTAGEAAKPVDDVQFRPKRREETRYSVGSFKRLDMSSASNDAISRPNNCDEEIETVTWLKWIPFVGIAIYYTIGVLVFGVSRQRPFADCLMFPLDFTVAGGVAQTEGYMRVIYGVYLEGAVVLAATTVSILQASASRGLTDIGLKYGLLTNSC